MSTDSMCGTISAFILIILGTGVPFLGDVEPNSVHNYSNVNSPSVNASLNHQQTMT